MAAFVSGKRKKPLMACPERRACLLLTRGRAVVPRRHPFPIRLKDRVGGDAGPVRVKIDSGSKITGVAIITDDGATKPAKLRCLFELPHRGRQISEALTARWAGDYCRTKLTAHGFPRGYGVRTDPINARHCKRLHRADVHGYAWRPARPAKAEWLQRGRLG